MLKISHYIIICACLIVVGVLVFFKYFNSSSDKLVISYPQNKIVQLYYDYIIDNMLVALKKNGMKKNIVIADHLAIDMGATETLKIHVNYEHTLVKKGGRGVDVELFGNITSDDNQRYLVRLVELNKYNNADIVIDYSLPNIENLKSSGLYPEVAAKTYYVPSIVYDKITLSNKRDITVLTTFFDRTQPRREALVEKFQKHKIDHVNKTGYFTYDEIQGLMLDTKILVNIHQTDQHHTFEELRVLPALMNGVIVIAEESPLKEQIPYHKYIIWAKYDDMLETVQHVVENYAAIYNNFYGEGSELYEIINDMQHTTNKTINDILVGSKPT